MHPTAKRLYEVAERKLGTKKPSKVALELGISHQVLKNWETRGVSLLGLMASHNIWGCNPDWIQTGEGNMFERQEAINSAETEERDDKSFVNVPRLSVKAGMGKRIAAPEHEFVTDLMSISRSWLTQNVAITSHTNLSIISGIGDSMSPTFTDGDILLVDTGVCEFRVDAIYVFSIDNELFIKRLQRLPGGVYKAISDNHMYEAFELNHDFKIHGRVIYAWNGRKL